MLAAEAALLLLLRKRVRRVVRGINLFDAGVGISRRALETRAVAAIRDALLPDFYQGRRTARTAGRAGLAREIAVVDRALAVPSSLAAHTETLDTVLANRAAMGYADTWGGYAAAEGATAEGATARAAWKLDLAATTETATAFNAERAIVGADDLFRPRLYATAEMSQAELAAARGLRDSAGRLLPSEAFRLEGVERRRIAERNVVEMQRRTNTEQWYKIWDASLDKRTCHICESSHSKAVLAGQDFPEGEPGAVHPRCRCVSTLLPASWVDTSYLF